jgi:hypothetical protein
MIKPQQRILLCRPQGGLTDILSQIGKCCRYAAMFRRKVFVETDFSGTLYFRDDFAHYFMSHDRDLVLSSRTIAPFFDDLDAVPAAFNGRINSYQAAYNSKLGAFTEVDGSEITSFNFNQNYTAPLLLHQAVGGGAVGAANILRRLSITPMMRNVVEERLAQIIGPYTGIHIRHTDYSTDYRERIIALKSEISGPIFIATDNRMALNFCREVFGERRVRSFSNVPDEVGMPIHSNSKLDPRQSNIDAISDLLLLAQAKKYYFFPLLQDTSSTPTFSGFSLLADILHRDTRLLQQIMRPETVGLSSLLRLRIRKTALRFIGWRKTIKADKG